MSGQSVAEKSLNQTEQLRQLLDEAVKFSEDHREKVCEAANTLVGPRMADEGVSASSPCGPGLIPPLKEKVHEILANLAMARDELQRITSELCQYSAQRRDE